MHLSKLEVRPKMRFDGFSTFGTLDYVAADDCKMSKYEAGAVDLAPPRARTKAERSHVTLLLCEKKVPENRKWQKSP